MLRNNYWKIKDRHSLYIQTPKVTNELFTKYFSRLSDMLWRSHDDFVYLGDMDCCPIKSHAIENICEQYDLTNLIKEPTCHKGPTPSLLDVISVSNPRRYGSSFNVYCGLSDFHNILGAATKRFAPSQKPRIIHYRSFVPWTKIFLSGLFLWTCQKILTAYPTDC